MAGWNSKGERECRARLEAKKGEFYKSSLDVEHPCLRIRDEQLGIAQANIRRHDWAKRHYDGMVELANHYADRTPAWFETMLPSLTPLHVYGTFARCVKGTIRGG